MEKCANLNVLLATFQDLCVWVCFLAGQVAGMREKRFFASCVAKVLVIGKIGDEEGPIFESSQRFLWPEVDLDGQILDHSGTNGDVLIEGGDVGVGMDVDADAEADFEMDET